MRQTQKVIGKQDRALENMGWIVGDYTAGETRLFESNDPQTAQSFSVQDNWMKP